MRRMPFQIMVLEVTLFDIILWRNIDSVKNKKFLLCTCDHFLFPVEGLNVEGLN